MHSHSGSAALPPLILFPHTNHTHSPIILPTNIKLLSNTNATLHYWTTPLSFTIVNNILSIYSAPLKGPDHIVKCNFNNTPVQIKFHLPATDNHHAFQYFYFWNKLCHAYYIFDSPLSWDTLLNLWSLVAKGHWTCTTTSIWNSLQTKHPNLRFPDLIKIFLSLVHCFGFGPNTDVPITYIPNHICTGNCLAYYLR